MNRAVLAAAIVTLASCTTTTSPSAPTPASSTAAPTTADLACAHEPETTAPEAPNGSLLYSSEDPSDVYLAPPDGSDPIRLTSRPRKEFDPDPSPDGRLVAYRVNPDPTSDAADIWVMGIDGRHPRNLTRDPDADNWSPAWSPDGSRIAFASTRAGELSVWTMRPDGRDPRQVTEGHGEYPDWSPDGSRIVYAGTTGGTYDIYTIAASGGEPTRLTDAPGTDFAPSWSPDGSRIAFQSERDGEWAVWLMSPDGSGQCRLAEPGAFPTWVSADEVAYVGEGGIVATSISTGRTRTLVATPGSGFPSWVNA